MALSDWVFGVGTLVFVGLAATSLRREPREKLPTDESIKTEETRGWFQKAPADRSPG
jgi:hypothetical protein